MAAWATAAPDDDTHLGDTLAMAEAAQALYRSTAQRRYLALATELGEVIVRDHRDPAGGFMVRRPDPGAKGVLRYLISLAEDGLVVPGVLLADRELGREPAHVTIVGGKDDPAARALYDVARTYPRRYLRIEWLDRRERGLSRFRHRISRDARGGGLRLRQRRLLGAGVHAGRSPSHRCQGRRPLIQAPPPSYGGGGPQGRRGLRPLGPRPTLRATRKIPPFEDPWKRC
jgi:hypothetical protein